MPPKLFEVLIFNWQEMWGMLLRFLYGLLGVGKGIWNTTLNPPEILKTALNSFLDHVFLTVPWIWSLSESYFLIWE